jgi:rare lipoprotein A
MRNKILLLLIFIVIIRADDVDKWLAELSKNNLKVCKIQKLEPLIVKKDKKRVEFKRVKHYPPRVKLKKVKRKDITYDKVGIASYYANCLNGCPTACGEPYRVNLLTAAHRTIPFGTMVCVTMLSTGKKVIVKVNDRGPYVRGRLIDLSFKAAKKIGLIRAGIGRVSIRIVR